MKGERSLLVWRGLAPYLWPYRGRALMALGALLLAAGVILAGGHQLRFLIDRGFGTNDPDILHRSILILWGGAVLLAIGSAARYYLVTWLGERVIADIRRDYMRHIISLDAAYYEGVHTGAALSTFTSDTAVVQSVVGSSLSVLLRNTLLLTGGGILLFLTSTKLTLLILFLVPVVVLPILFFGRQVRQLSKKTQSKLAEVSAGLGEVLSGIKTVQAFVREPYEFARFSRNNEDVFFFASKRMLARAILTFSVILLIMTGISVILWVGSRDVVSGNVSGGDLAAFVFYAIIVASSFGAIGEQFAELQRAAGAMDRILATLSLKPQITSPLDAAPLRQPTRGAVTFTKVNFSYPSRPENAVLRDFSLDIAPGEKLAIVGPSGAGKTTLFQLLLRFFDPVSGVVAFDGLDLRHLALADLRQAISIVSQDPVLFSSSIEENIRYGHPDASKDDILKAAKLAHATEFIELLPKGFATEIGERGVTLSGGQRQRIAIARAILRDPALLLLDEATSALDSQSEKAVQEALDAVMLGRTTVIIAHRLSTILKADRIVVLNNGRIEDTGRHGDLINKDGLYTHLANLQFGLELPPKN